MPLNFRKNTKSKKSSRVNRRMSVEPLEHRQLLTTLMVDAVGDVANGDLSPGDVTLREAVELANFLEGPDTIVFDTDGVFANTSNILLTGGEIEITESLTIEGTGPDELLLDGQNNSRIFHITAADGDFGLKSLTLTGGNVVGRGGAVRIDSGELRVENSLITGNVSSSYGGGIYATSSVDLTVKRSTVRSNSGSWGGGILSYGQTTIEDSTISGNSSSAGGGGLYVADTVVSNSTITNNTAGSGGGGIDLDGAATLTINNSIVAGNTASSNEDIRIRYGSTVTSEYSLIGDAAGVEIGGTGNIIGDSTGGGVVDPMLTPLGDYGGALPTHALLPGSPAINAADPSISFDAASFDQRGSMFFRVQDARMDMGAVEDLPTELMVDNLADNSDGVVSAGEVSLREAVELANLDPGPNTISFATSGAFAGSTQIDLTAGELEITESTSFNGPGADRLTIDAGGNSRIFNFTATDGDFTVSGLKLTGADGDAGRGGAIRIEGGNVIVVGSAIVGNTASDLATGQGYGGGIYASDAASLTLRDSTVSGNSARFGGGLLALANLTVENSTVSANTALYGGGGIFGVNADIRNSTITNNVGASTHGGAGIDMTSNAGASLNLESSIVAGNATIGANYRPDIDPFDAALTVRYTMIGDADGVVVSGSGNIIGDSQAGGIVDPQLAPLANNGGPTQTHALLPSSFAINEGDRFAVAGEDGVPSFDQRGEGFTRVYDERIDMGAIEFQPTSSCFVAGDLDCSGTVGAGDLNLVLNNWGIDTNVVGVPQGWIHDLPNGIISAEELNMVLNNWGSSGPTASPIVAMESDHEPRQKQTPRGGDGTDRNSRLSDRVKLHDQVFASEVVEIRRSNQISTQIRIFDTEHRSTPPTRTTSEFEPIDEALQNWI